ncbi:hypothetical protein [Streptomyces indicus]|uniref:Uncharacterized protein n=1 Tax=Streptomyces indicus TaxID=417292 RepID=A0A1G9IUW2_9ACTN|nr:hypothetical protein [Streptomyces indicus]SDL28604.1 hypothetical protein SAMN05421806_12566 [Streptomyces indicus]
MTTAEGAPAVDSHKARALAAAIRRHCNTSASGYVFDHPDTIAGVALEFLKAHKERTQAQGRWTNPTIKRLLAQHYPRHIPTVVIEQALRHLIGHDHGTQEQR